MNKIVIDARELRTSSGRYVERLLYYLQKIDDEHKYKILLTPKDFDGWQPSNPNFEKVKCPYKEFTYAEQISLLRQIRNFKADLVHFPFPQQPISYKGKTVTTIHDLTTLRFSNPDKHPVVFKIKQAIFAGVIKRDARKSSVVIADTEFTKQDLVKFAGINSDKVKVTHLAADKIEEAADPLPALIDKQFLMYVGRPMPHKNLLRLIEAYISLKSTHPELMLILAGKKDGNYQRIEDMVRQRAIKGIVFTGLVSEARLRWLYENCQTYVFPSLSEGFGLPGLEAMMHGAPVVSSNATCLPEVYGDAAHYFDPYDVRAMSQAIDEVLTDKKLREELVKKGRQQAAKYSWERMARQTLDAYNQALKN